ncbi:hypothetical protein VLI63_15125 [Lacisediminihabitans sp. H27-G8]
MSGIIYPADIGGPVSASMSPHGSMRSKDQALMSERAAASALGARHAFTHFQCAPGLLWIAEALGEDWETVQLAADTAAGVGRPGTQCAAIRRLIPWQRIQTLPRYVQMDVNHK